MPGNENTKSGILQGLFICRTSELNPRMIEVSRFQKLKIFKRFVVPWTCGLILLAVLAGCSSKEPEVFFRRGERDVLKFKAIQACHGNFRILEETDFGPFIRAKLKCIKRELRG